MHRSIVLACCALGAAAVVGLTAALPAYADRAPSLVAQQPNPEQTGKPTDNPTDPTDPPTTPPTTTPPPTTPPVIQPTQKPTPKPTQTATPTKTAKPAPAKTRQPTGPAKTQETFTPPPEGPSDEASDGAVVMQEQEDGPSADPAAGKASIDAKAGAGVRKDVAFIIIGVGAAALLGLAGIAGLYFTSGRRE